jgi:hypothetical protein
MTAVAVALFLLWAVTYGLLFRAYRQINVLEEQIARELAESERLIEVSHQLLEQYERLEKAFANKIHVAVQETVIDKIMERMASRAAEDPPSGGNGAN